MTQQAQLITHAGSSRVTRQQLAGIATPLSTATHRPISHAELMDVMEGRLLDAGYQIQREQYAVQRAGLMLFGTLDLVNGHATADYGLALGFRHSNDRHMALTIVGGSRVFVCDNLALVGSERVFNAPHRHGVIARLTETLGSFFRDKLPMEFVDVATRFERWGHAPLRDPEAKVLIYDALHHGVIPHRLRPDVHEAYFRASDLGYVDCAPRSVLGLHNAFTRSFKALNPAPAYTANVALTRLFG
jgi:hypothetical protein